MFHMAAGDEVQKNAGIASMNVNTTQDDANNQKIRDKVTLRDAIQTGNNGPPQPAVTFFQNVDAPLMGTISLQAALDPIKASYDIVGSGSLTVQGQGAANPFRVFTVNAGVTSTIQDLTIENGYVTTVGGGIGNAGKVTLKYVTLLNNQAVGGGGPSGGGAIFNSNGATLDMNSVTVNGNSTDGYGGGILNYGNLDCSGSSIVNNAANGVLGSGAGLANLGGSAHLHNKTQVSGNTAGSRGGGIYESGGTVSATTAFVTGGVAINNNTASLGGGIYVYTGSLTLSSETAVSSNKATGAYGGGIAMVAGTATISTGKISDNSALNGGGGGIWILGARLTLNNEKVSYNSANTNGGGIAMAGGKTVAGGTVIVSGGSIQSNTAGNSGGGIYNVAGALLLGLNNNETAVNDNDATNQGGGLYLASPSRTTFNDCLVSGNSANTGKGVYEQNGATVFIVNLTDDDDPNGKPVPGP